MLSEIFRKRRERVTALLILIMNLLPILNIDGQKVVTTFLGVEKSKNIKSAGSLLKTIHLISIVAAGVIVLRFVSVWFYCFELGEVNGCCG